MVLIEYHSNHTHSSLIGPGTESDPCFPFLRDALLMDCAGPVSVSNCSINLHYDYHLVPALNVLRTRLITVRV